LVKSPFVFVGVLLTCIVHALNALRSAARNLGAWAVIPLAAICVGFCIVVPCLLLGIMLSALAKVAASALWPAYVACGWLRLAGAHRQHRRPITVVLREACQAAYQVVWAADIVTNSAILMRSDIASKTFEEFAEIAQGRRNVLSPSCRRVSWLPPTTIGILRGGGEGWRVELRAVAAALKVDETLLEEAWNSFFAQMEATGKRCLERGLLTAEFVWEVPPALFIGLPALVLYELVARSPVGEERFVLANGRVIDAAQRPCGRFAAKAWDHLMDAKRAHEIAMGSAGSLTEADRTALEAVLLSGGAAELPAALTAAVASATQPSGELPAHLKAVYKPLYAVAYDAAQQQLFKQQFASAVLEKLGAD